MPQHFQGKPIGVDGSIQTREYTIGTEIAKRFEVVADREFCIESKGSSLAPYDGIDHSAAPAANASEP
jgi:single-stranded DNA-binding protein